MDRGKQSLETICLLLSYKIKYPENFFLLRGNHECASINRIYGFYDECKRRFNIRLWKTFTDCFNCLPVAALIDEKILCMHGGLSPDLKNLDQIKKIARPTDVPDVGLLCDLLWADPDKEVAGWGENDRGVSFTFGPDTVSDFLQKHDLDLICRAHQVCFHMPPYPPPPPNPSPTSFSPPFIFFYFPFKSISGDIQEQKCSCCNLAKQVEARGSTLRASTNQKSKEKSATEGSLFQRCFTNYEKALEVAGGNTPVYQSLRRNPLTKSSLHGATSKCFVGSQQKLPKASVAETRLVLIFVLVRQWP